MRSTTEPNAGCGEITARQPYRKSLLSAFAESLGRGGAVEPRTTNSGLNPSLSMASPLIRAINMRVARSTMTSTRRRALVSGASNSSTPRAARRYSNRRCRPLAAIGDGPLSGKARLRCSKEHVTGGEPGWRMIDHGDARPGGRLLGTWVDPRVSRRCASSQKPTSVRSQPKP